MLRTPSPFPQVCAVGAGPKIAFGAADGLICLADLRMWRKAPPRLLDAASAVLTLRGHRGPVESLAAVPSYPDVLFSASVDGSLRVPRANDALGRTWTVA